MDVLVNSRSKATMKLQTAVFHHELINEFSELFRFYPVNGGRESCKDYDNEN